MPGQHAGTADVALGDPGRERSQLRRHAVAANQQLGDCGGAGRGQVHAATAGADGHHHVVGGRRAEQPDRARGRLLDALQQGVGSAFGHPVGVLDDQHLVAADRGRHRGPSDEFTHLVHPDRELLGAHQGDVRMRAGQYRSAGLADPATALGTLQRGGERAGRVGASRTGRAGDQPGVAHRVRTAAHRAAQHLDRPALPHQVGPHGHCWILSPRADNNATTRSRTRSAMAFIGSCAGSTR